MRRRVLVVDDEDDFLATYERLLRREGYDVITATTRAAGLAALDVYLDEGLFERLYRR